MQPNQPIPTPPAQPPSYTPAPTSSYGQPTSTVINPGKGFGIAGFVLAFVAGVQLVGLVLSIIGLVKSSKAGMKNGLALAGVILNSVTILLWLILVPFIIVALQGAQERASESRYDTYQRDSIQRNL